MEQSLLVVYPHGLGDHVLLTPALRKYSKLHPDTKITIASLSRFGPKVEQLLGGLPYIHSFLPDLPDPWNDFKSYEEGIKFIKQRIVYNFIGKFDEVKLILHKPREGFLHHKIFRTAFELGVSFDSIDELATELAVDDEYLLKAQEFVKDYDRPLLVLHNKAGNPPKEIPEDVLEKIVNDTYSKFTVLEFGKKSTSHSIEVPEDDFNFTKALISIADQVCAIDSVVMHIAGAFRKDLLAIFLCTPVHQAIPLFGNVHIAGNDSPLTEIRNWENYRQDLLRYFDLVPTTKGQVLITGTGHSGGNWVTEIVNLSGEYKFTEAVEDRNLFSYNVLPDGYATKLAIENYFVNIKNLDRLLKANPNLKIIYTMRHPVDNCLSMIYRAIPAEENEKFSGNWIDYHPTGTRIGAIKDIEYSQMILDFLKEKYNDRVLVVKLEDLIEDTEGEVDKICKFLEIPKNSKMLEAYKYSRNPHHEKRYNKKLDKKQAEIRKHLDTVYDGFFKNKKNLVDHITKILQPIVRDFGYVDVDNSNADWKPTSKYLKLPDYYYQNNNYWAHMITSKCNAECEYCLVNGRGPHKRQIELSGKRILEWWNNIEHPNGWPLSFMARETTMHPDIVEIINNIDGYYVTLTTNCVGSFYTKGFEKRFKPQPSTKLRINTSYHPHALEPEKYIERIKRFRDAGFHVGQTMFVYTPEVMEKWGDRIKKVQEELELESPPYLGFWNDKDRYKAKPCPENLMPNEKYHDQEMALKQCGIDDYDLYRKWCGQSEPKTVYCPHALMCLLVSPAGRIYHCHYRMYYDKQPICDIKNFQPIKNIEQLKCNFHGMTNWCDYPRLRRAIQIFKAEGINWLEEIKS